MAVVPNPPEPARGQYRSIPSHRRMVLDICWAARGVPAFPVDRTMQLAELAEARQAASPRVSWAAIFIRGYALVCREVPELRQLFVHWPWARLYQHPNTVASVSIHRLDDRGQPRLIWGRIPNAEQLSLAEVQQRLDHATSGALREVYRDGIRLERLPTLLRRVSWFLAMRWQGRQRAKKIGTFSLSTLAGENASNRFHPLVVTSSLAYTRCQPDGRMEVTLIADHRVVDGVLAARALARLEELLTQQILSELRASSAPPSWLE